MNKKKLADLYSKISHPVYLPLAVFIAVGALIALGELSSDEGMNPHLEEPIQSADTFIPLGFVLVPVQLHNEQSLHSLLGSYGVVDLYLPAESRQRQGAKVADNVRMIRAPLNPNQFAVLVPEDDSQELVKQGGPFIAVLQNPENAKGGVVQEKKKTNRITYGY